MSLSTPDTVPDPVNPELDDPEVADPDPADELDDPYVHTVSTEEFVEAVETASREANPEDA